MRATADRVRSYLLALGCFPVFLVLLVFLGAPAAGAGSPVATCDAWLGKSLTRMEKRGEQKWRDAVIGMLADAPCGSLPVELRTAFRAGTATKDPDRRDHLLAEAASRVLGPKCAVQDPMNDARPIAAACPLPDQPELRISHALRDILAVDYLVLNAIATSFLAGNEYGESAKRLVMDFALSASLRGERVRESKAARSRGRR